MGDKNININVNVTFVRHAESCANVLGGSFIDRPVTDRLSGYGKIKEEDK